MDTKPCANGNLIIAGRKRNIILTMLRRLLQKPPIDDLSSLDDPERGITLSCNQHDDFEKIANAVLNPIRLFDDGNNFFESVKSAVDDD